MAKRKVRAAIYARVSTIEQNPEAQLQDLRAYVENRGFTLHKEYVDQVTGDVASRSKKRKRKDLAYEQLMADASKRLFDCVIVWKYDRFARSLSVLVTALDEFKSLGIDFISITQAIDTTTPMGRLFYNVIGSFAEFEKALIGERVKAGLANAKGKGVRLGRPEKDPSAGTRIATLREEGWSLRQIAKRESLSPSGVLKILKRSQEAKSESIAREPKAIPEIWQLKIYLTMVKPQVWRRVLVPADITLTRLSDVIQKLFGWTDLYPHEFVPRDARGFGFSLECDEDSFRLCDLELKPGDGMLYEYGCLNWTHEVTFEKTARFDDQQEYPVCTAGAMAAPSDEDCDGALEYMEAKKTRTGRKFNNLAKKAGIELYCIDKWLLEFDPHHFDLDEINQRLGVRSPQAAKVTKPKVSTGDNRHASPATPDIYQLRIVVCGISPPIWRQVLVSSQTSLEMLSDIIQRTLDWEGHHLHRFHLPGAFADTGSRLDVSEHETSLADLGFQLGDILYYEYDFGDQWTCEVIFEKVLERSSRRRYPTCIAGKNAGPPEDCGGPEAYMYARGTLKRAKGKKRRDRLPAHERQLYNENYPDFDPDRFDRAAVNREFRELERDSKRQMQRSE